MLRPKLEEEYGYSHAVKIGDDLKISGAVGMDDFIKVSGFRNSIYKKQFPAGIWLEVKGLAIKGQLIEIDM